MGLPEKVWGFLKVKGEERWEVEGLPEGEGFLKGWERGAS